MTCQADAKPVSSDRASRRRRLLPTPSPLYWSVTPSTYRRYASNEGVAACSRERLAWIAPRRSPRPSRTSRARHRDDVGARLGIDHLKHDRIARPAQSADAPDQNRANGAAVGQLPSDLGRDVHRVGFARRAEHAAELLARERAEIAGLV